MNGQLKVKSARIIATIGEPGWYYRLMYGTPAINHLKKNTLGLYGVSPVKTTCLRSVKKAGDKKRSQWLEKVYYLGKALK